MRKENSTNSESKDRQFDWFYMMPYDIEEIIQHCGFSKFHWKEYEVDYLSIMKTFCRKQTKHGDIRLSVLRKAMNLKNYKVFDTIVDCKWLFYKYPVGEYRKDFVIQPVFDTSRLTPLQYSQAVEALRDSDYQELTRIIPFRVRPELKKQELLDYDTNGDATASIPNTTSFSYVLSSKEGSGREAAAPQTESVKITNYPDSNPDSDHESNLESNPESNTESNPESNTESNLESSPRNNMYACLDKKQETRDKKQDIISGRRRNNQVTLADVRGQNPPPDQKNFDSPAAQGNSALMATEAFLARLQPDDFDARKILEACGANRRFFTDNFDKLKTALLEYAKLRGKPDSTDERNIASFFVNCMGIKNVNRKIFSRVEELAKSASEFHKGTDPRYPFDVLNEQGLGVSQGKVIPQDAPPKPTKTAVRMNGKWMMAQTIEPLSILLSLYCNQRKATATLTKKTRGPTQKDLRSSAKTSAHLAKNACDR